jgi:uncharacterized membrane protein
MGDENQSTDSAEGKPKKLNLDALLPAKGSITTSIGTLYARHPHSSDWKDFDLEDSAELGRVVIQRLCNRIEDKHDSSALHDDDLKLLTDADYQELVQAIAKQSGWRELPDGSGLKELGELIKEEKQAMTERHEKMLADLRKSIDSSYSFLGKGVLDKLQAQMAGIANIRSSLAGAESLQAAVRAAALPEESWRKSLAGMDTIDKPMRGLNAENVNPQIPSYKTHDLPKFIAPPRFEETPMGRATLESVEISRSVAKKVDDLVVVVAGLNQTLVQDVLPAWFNKIKEDQTSAKGAFEQAARGLWWTKWAVIASVFVTIVATWWQVDVARSIDRENSEQQKRAEAVLREQLAAQQKLIEQQAKDAAAMREVVTAMKEAGPMSRPQKR